MKKIILLISLLSIISCSQADDEEDQNSNNITNVELVFLTSEPSNVKIELYENANANGVFTDELIEEYNYTNLTGNNDTIKIRVNRGDYFRTYTEVLSQSTSIVKYKLFNYTRNANGLLQEESVNLCNPGTIGNFDCTYQTERFD